LTHTKALALLTAVLVWNYPIAGKAKKGPKDHAPTVEVTGPTAVALWHAPGEVPKLDLFYGVGGKEHEPKGPFTFVEEDMAGSNPKIVVRDPDGAKWKVKMGNEAQPETTASRFVWAVGFYTTEDYYVENLHVDELPAKLRRGQKFVSADGVIHGVRLKRHAKGEENSGIWTWKQNPFHDTRELNGLRTLMAVLNNWDLKDANNAIYKEKRSGDKEKAADTKDSDSDATKEKTKGTDADGTKEKISDREPPHFIFLVSDLGASFGSTGLERTHELSKNNLQKYSQSVFIRDIHEETVDFECPRRATLMALADPAEFFRRLGLRWIGRNIPRADARWMGQQLALLTPAQIRDAFRAGGYSSEEVEGFARVVENRIAQLNKL
jgi:hypothetical protein